MVVTRQQLCDGVPLPPPKAWGEWVEVHIHVSDDDDCDGDDLLDRLDVPVTFGLSRDQVHEIARRRATNETWKAIAADMHWEPATLCEFFERGADVVFGPLTDDAKRVLDYVRRHHGVREDEVWSAPELGDLGGDYAEVLFQLVSRGKLQWYGARNADGTLSSTIPMRYRVPWRPKRGITVRRVPEQGPGGPR